MNKSKLLWIAGIIIVIFNIVFYWFRFGGPVVLQYVSDLLPILSSLIASVILYIAFKKFKTFDFIKVSWFLLFLGILLFLLGESIYSYLEIITKTDMNENFPSIADIFWCAGYIPQFIALFMIINGYRKSGMPMGNIKSYLFLTFLFLIIAASIINYLLIPIIIDPETDLLTKIFSLFYPVADLFLLIPALILIYITYILGNGNLARPWKYIAIGYFFFTIADLLYSYLSWMDIYGNGNFIDIGWNAGYLLVALSAAYQSELIESVFEG